ncbi:uncharacterized protein EV422DRAFT_507880 [Fimicolochytrium jonesii]|uniref:uncharacterized protein n=1 Tax=Fimicolochytrium jonesii TaxID=1396493 RepID=UPI0022FE9386|nr:uncharacterized protein EV422DRAFT_507880 [Fimicolochytrium jonesii]KAI8818698.1 hypothetical protein EV422DRAFT_507880 [Fimicolochytrium jonesii]
MYEMLGRVIVCAYRWARIVPTTLHPAFVNYLHHSHNCSGIHLPHYWQITAETVKLFDKELGEVLLGMRDKGIDRKTKRETWEASERFTESVLPSVDSGHALSDWPLRRSWNDLWTFWENADRHSRSIEYHVLYASRDGPMADMVKGMGVEFVGILHSVPCGVVMSLFAPVLLMYDEISRHLEFTCKSAMSRDLVNTAAQLSRCALKEVPKDQTLDNFVHAITGSHVFPTRIYVLFCLDEGQKLPEYSSCSKRLTFYFPTDLLDEHGSPRSPNPFGGPLWDGLAEIHRQGPLAYGLL